MSVAPLQHNSGQRQARRAAAAPLLALDIGSHNVKCVVRQRSGEQWQIVQAGCLTLSPDAARSPERLAAQLRPFLRDSAARCGREFICSLPSGLVDFEAVTLGDTTGPMEAAQARLQSALGERWQEASFDYWTANPPQTDTPELHIAWTSHRFAHSLAQALAEGGYHCRAIDVAPCSLARCLADGIHPSRNQLIVDVGAGEVSMFWTQSGTARYVRNRKRFSNSATTVVAGALNVEHATAETLLHEWGIDVSCKSQPASRIGCSDGRGMASSSGDHAMNNAVQQASPIAGLLKTLLDDWLRSLCQEIERTLHYLKTRHPKHAINEVVLLGGGACIRGLAPVLESKLHLQVHSGRLPLSYAWKAAVPFSPLYLQAVSLLADGGNSWQPN